MRNFLRALLLCLGLTTLIPVAHAVGESTNGFPNWQERVIHTWMNRARAEPQLEMTACGANCGEAACYTAQPPLTYSLPLNRAARFHSDEQLRQSYFAHDSACTVVNNISSIYPASCDGSASCACVGGTKTCSPTCTTFSPRVSLFGVSGSGEIIASPTDPNQAFYLWLYEPSAAATCAFSSANGHRWLILKSTGGVGVGVSGPSVGDFGAGVVPPKIPSGSHYPRQAASIQVWANWYDTAAPSIARVNVDGVCTTMSRARGTAQNSAFTATLTGLASGCHRYYFEYKDSASQDVTYPTTGSLGIGPAGGCADWDSSRPATCNAPVATVPGAPTLISATPGNGQATISFAPPAQNGGSAITGYTVSCAGAGNPAASATNAPITVSGMTNGQSYSCGVLATNAIGNSAVSGHLLVTPNTGTPLALLAVVSRKLHGAPPPFDLPINFSADPVDAISVEPRSIGQGHVIVFKFNAAIFSAGSATATDSTSGAIAAMIATPAGDEVIVTLPTLPDARRVTISLTNVNGAGVNATASIGFLIGDINGSRSVNAADISGIKSRTSANLNTGNFRFDLNTSGSIDASDVLAAKVRSGNGLP